MFLYNKEISRKVVFKHAVVKQRATDHGVVDQTQATKHPGSTQTLSSSTVFTPQF